MEVGGGGLVSVSPHSTAFAPTLNQGPSIQFDNAVLFSSIYDAPPCHDFSGIFYHCWLCKLEPPPFPCHISSLMDVPSDSIIRGTRSISIHRNASVCLNAKGEGILMPNGTE